MHGAKWQGDVLFCIYDHYRGDEALATLRVGGGAVLANVERGGGVRTPCVGVLVFTRAGRRGSPIQGVGGRRGGEGAHQRPSTCAC